MHAWQPITTAPRDGHTILAYLPAKAGLPTRQDVVAIFWAAGSGWATAYSGAHLDAEPAYWMPLPQAPTSTGSDRDSDGAVRGQRAQPGTDVPVQAGPIH